MPKQTDRHQAGFCFICRKEYKRLTDHIRRQHTHKVANYNQFPAPPAHM